MQPWIKAPLGSKHDVANLVTDTEAEEDSAHYTSRNRGCRVIPRSLSFVYTAAQGLLEGRPLKSPLDFKSPSAPR